jgi:hypothetical protein
MLANHLLMLRWLCTLWLKKIRVPVRQIQDRMWTLFLIIARSNGANIRAPLQTTIRVQVSSISKFNQKVLVGAYSHYPLSMHYFAVVVEYAKDFVYLGW